MPSPSPIQDATFLGSYAKTGAFTDCYATTVGGSIGLPEFIESFYTTPLFKVERWILARAVRRPSTDAQAHELAHDRTKVFAAWKVEDRSDTQILMQAWQTRSWLSVTPAQDKRSTILLFGSAVLPMSPDGKFGFAFHALLGFHRLYSKLLLSAAARRVIAKRSKQSAT